MGGFGLDYATKLFCLQYLDPYHPIELLGGLVTLRLIRNPGAAFSMGEQITPLLTSLAIAALIATICWLAPRVRHAGWAVATGFLLAGISGNLADRLFREPGVFVGHVVDFIQLPYFAIFNVADIWITSAAVLIIWLTVITQVTPSGVSSGDESARSSAAVTADRSAMLRHVASENASTAVAEDAKIEIAVAESSDKESDA